jgi:drug/metabolite transporter (DMT)-like permease
VSNTIKAILLILATMAVFTVLDATAKYLNQSLPLVVTVFFRYAIALVIALVLLLRRGGVSLLLTRHPALQVSRGFFLLASTFLNFFAMSYLQLAQTAAISFTVPLWVCALSVPLLGEKVGLRRWLAVLVGFCGVLIIMRPGSMDFHWAMLVSLCSSLCAACYNLATRKVGGKDAAETSLLYVCLVGSMASAPVAALSWQLPVGLQWLWLVMIGAAGAGGHLMLIEAHRKATAATLAPFVYSQIIWMTMAGVVLFGQWPDAWTVIGALIVVASGIYVFNRERRRGVTTPAAVPED